MKFKLRPELGKPMYWVHVLLITAIITAIFWIYSALGYPMTAFNAFILLFISLIVADVVAHTLLKLD